MPQSVLKITQPPLIGLLRWAHTLAITHAYEQTHGWFFTNFVQLSCTRHYVEKNVAMMLDFWRGGQTEMVGNNPFLTVRIVGYDSFTSTLKRDTIVPNLIGALLEGHYPMVFLEEGRLNYSVASALKVFHPHHTLLYGVDTARECFFAMGFGGERRNSGKFGPQSISFAEMVAATDDMRVAVEDGRHGEEYTYFFKPKIEGPLGHGYSFDRDVLRAAITEYLESTTTDGRYNHNRVDRRFGLGVYEELDRYFALVAEGVQLSRRDDIRHIHILHEHKNVMASRLLYLMAKGVLPKSPGVESLLSECRRECQRLMVTKLLAMKYDNGCQPEYLLSMRKALRLHKAVDENLFARLLALL